MLLIKFTKWLNRFARWVTEIPDLILIIISFILIPVVYYFLVWFVLLISGRKESFQKFKLDKVGFFWPFHQLALSVMILIISIESEFVMKINFVKMGYLYTGLLKQNNIWRISLIILFILAVIISIYYIIESRQRKLENHERTTWLTEGKCIFWFQRIFASFVVFILIVSAGFIICQWGNLFIFFYSNWSPNYVLSTDLFFNTGWIRELLVKELFLVFLLSFTPFILSIREKNYGPTKSYIRTFIIGFFGIIIVSLSLIYSYNQFLSNIKEITLSNIISSRDIYKNSSMSIIDYYGLLNQNFYFYYISQLPDSLALPTWLNGTIGIRLIVYVLEIINNFSIGMIKIPNELIEKAKKFFT